MAIVPIHTTKDDGTEEITYVQVGPPSMLEPGSMSVQDLMEQMNLFIQYGVDWKKDFLRDISAVVGSCCDYPVFCRDGVAWTNRFLLASISKMVDTAMAESDDCSCLVIPDTTKEEFEKFHLALFSETGVSDDKSMSLVKHVSQILDV